MKRFVVFLFVCSTVELLAAPVTSAPVGELADTLREVVVVQPRMQMMEQQVIGTQQRFGLKQIETEQRLSVKDFGGSVPNLYVPDYGSRMTSSVYVRGLGARIDQPVIGVYVDGIGLVNKNMFDFTLFDVQRVQFARGPQGTMFGRNTIGGIMQIETLSPLVYQGTRASLGYGNGNTIEAQGAHYLLFKGKEFKGKSRWGMSVGAAYRHTDGFYRNEYDNSQADRQDETNVRVRVDGITRKRTRVNNTLSYNYLSQSGFPYHLPQEGINHNDKCGYERHQVVAGSSYTFLVGDYALGGTTSYQLLRDEMTMDQDYLPQPYFTLVQRQTEHTVTQEVTLKPQERRKHWDWLTGVSVAYKHNRMSAPVTFKQTGIDSLILKHANGMSSTAAMEMEEKQFVIGDEFTTQTATVAAYHSSFWQVKDWRFEAGIRVELEHQRFEYASESDIHLRLHYFKDDSYTPYTLIETALAGQQRQTYVEALPKVGVQYVREKEKSRWRVYATVAEGYKAGGYNTQLFSDILRQEMMRKILMSKGQQDIQEIIRYKPEHCLSSEVGVENTWRFADGRWSSSVTLYELELFNQQLTVFPENSTGRRMTNAGRSRSMGGEVSTGLQYKDLSVDVSYGYTYAYFVRYQDGEQDYAGKIVPYMPQNTLAASVSYGVPLKHKFFHRLTLNVNTTAVGQIFWDERNETRQGFYGLLNANIVLKMKYLSVQLWGKNLTNTGYDVFSFVSMNNRFVQSGKPISFGGKVSIEI